jgi:hypothetical protein
MRRHFLHDLIRADGRHNDRHVLTMSLIGGEPAPDYELSLYPAAVVTAVAPVRTLPDESASI